ncbi:MAG TPA: hypothetical protein VFI95_02160 [Terriglobales bacterium]|nr:hypothetical protein [Terriglobales bacterium]
MARRGRQQTNRDKLIFVMSDKKYYVKRLKAPSDGNLGMRDRVPLRFVPGVDYLDWALDEVCYVARGELSPPDLGNRSNLRVRVAYGSSKCATVSRNSRERPSCLAVESENPTV